mgnify:CR=1 FL=1
MSAGDYDYNDTSTAYTGTVVDYDLEDRIVRINDMSLMNDPEDVLRYIHVPEGVNIFSLLNLDQPSNATNISNWKVGISTKHQYYPNITAVLDVSNNFSLPKLQFSIFRYRRFLYRMD